MAGVQMGRKALNIGNAYVVPPRCRLTYLGWSQGRPGEEFRNDSGKNRTEIGRLSYLFGIRNEMEHHTRTGNIGVTLAKNRAS